MFSKSKFSGGFLIGFGAGFVARDLLLDQSSVCRPFAKSALKTAYTLYDKTRESIAFAMENIEDLFAEVRAETKKGPAKTAAATSTTPKVKMHERTFGPELRDAVPSATTLSAQNA